jgi:hypothetical protein
LTRNDRNHKRRLADARVAIATLAAASILVGTGAARGDPKTGNLAPLPRPVAVAAPADPQAEADLFVMPEIADETRRALALVQADDFDGAAGVFDRLIALHPDLGLLRANRAAVAMLAGSPDLARAHLEAAAERGFAEAGADPLFAAIADAPALAARAAAINPPAVTAAPEPAPVSAGVAPVTAANTAWNLETERLEPRFAFPEKAEAPVLPAAPRNAARDLLRDHVKYGRAAGNHGDLYDNRDRGHSALRPEDHPQLAHVTYASAARAAGLDYGLNDRIIFNHPTLGNSSTAITTGPQWRSLPRYAMTRPDGAGPMRLWQTAAANHVYVHPAHKDYGADHGDLFPANTPYLLVSRGSSGSDKPFLEAVAMILAAFLPDAKAKILEADMANSTVQMVFRRSLQNVRSRESYFSGDAHPAVFEGYEINLARMVSLANSIKADAIPAEARIRVIEETLGIEGVDFFGPGLEERLFDTPQAVARIWRSSAGRRSMVLSAEDSRDANGRPLEFHWRLLQGDPAKVTIEPLDDGARARVTIDWHDPFRISEENDQIASRVDIGVFADNGAHDSAPAILSWTFPAHETRVYERGADGAPRVLSIDYADPAKAKVYADPLLYPRPAWRDVHRYDTEGRSLGWTRHRRGGAEAAFGPEGAQAGSVTPAIYALEDAPDGRLVVRERPLAR